MCDAALDPETWPGRGRNFKKVDAEILGDRHAFPLCPAYIRIEQQFGVFGEGLVHQCPFQQAPAFQRAGCDTASRPARYVLSAEVTAAIKSRTRCARSRPIAASMMRAREFGPSRSSVMAWNLSVTALGSMPRR